jgi:hypothetical protein
MALVDYKGFRLIAMSILPLNGSETLKYGSNDASDECNVHTDNILLTEKISETSRRMNLKPHYCGKPGRDKILYSAIDLEGNFSLFRKFCLFQTNKKFIFQVTFQMWMEECIS